MHHVRWIAAPLALLGLLFLFFGLLWTAGVQLAVGTALLVAAGLIWRAAGSSRSTRAA